MATKAPSLTERAKPSTIIRGDKAYGDEQTFGERAGHAHRQPDRFMARRN